MVLEIIYKLPLKFKVIAKPAYLQPGYEATVLSTHTRNQVDPYVLLALQFHVVE